ncbi:MAG: hypothetical protein ACI9FG_000170 [Crocinitomicaceae bacterium]|jgi:hypothetical protein
MASIVKKIGLSKASVWIFAALLLTQIFLAGNYGPKSGLHDYVAPDGAQWITTQDGGQYTGCFRRDVELTSEVGNAWIGVVSDGGFELVCNGDAVGAQGYWRPTRIFQNGLTEPAQRLLGREPIVAYNFPREYQWTGHNNTMVVTLFDLRPYLKKGKNSICLELEGRSAQPEVLAFGSILTKNGQLTEIRTDGQWFAEPVPLGLGQNSWVKPLYSTSHWSRAQTSTNSRKSFVSKVPRKVYEEAFQGEWVLKDEHDGNSSYVAGFDVSEPVGGSMRIASYGDFWLWVNGERVDVKGAKGNFNAGEWDVAWSGRRPLATSPVLLDPDEVGSFFSGKRFEDPRHGDPTENDFKRYENTQNRTRERPNQTGANLLSDGDEERGREQDPYGFYEEADAALPLALLRKGLGVQFHAYDIGAYLKSGSNTLRVKLVEKVDVGYKGSQPLKFSLDGRVEQEDGSELALTELNWKSEDGSEAQAGYKVQPTDLPTLEFYQISGSRYNRFNLFFLVPLAIVFSVFIPRWYAWAGKFCAIYSVILGLVALVAFSMAERSEYVWFLTHNRGPLLVLLSMIFATIIYHWGRGMRGPIGTTSHNRLCLLVLLVLVFITRGWMVHFQPIDDDEYASIQAVLAIAETGKPGLAGEVWYSRSPLYHYLAAAVVKVFGPHIWSLRLYSVVLSVLTAWVLWGIAMRFFRDRWIACASVLVFALHPFLIFSGHIARFYQQQQLMVLLMVFLFIEGFIERRGIWYRVGAIVLFSFAVLSQEISITFVPVFLIAYLLFGKGVPFRWDLKSLIYLFIAVLLVAADILLFKVKCITESVGVSPNVEATVAPTFWELGNLASMFIGYSRIHLVLGVFYIVSFIYSIRRGSSVAITLHAFLLISVVTFNFLITSVSFRYMYSVIPIWILLGVHGVRVFSKWVAAQSNYSIGVSLRWVILLAVIASMSPWRIPGSYNEKILGDPISSLAYVRAEMRVEDKIMITEPHPHAAMIELGKVDYDLVVPILYDFTYRAEGLLRDRNGNAVVVNRLADLQKIFATDERVWIILNREKFRSRKKNIRWEYPGAREELFIRQNCELKYRSYLWAVYLWDQSSGDFDTFRKEPGSWVE